MSPVNFERASQIPVLVKLTYLGIAFQPAKRYLQLLVKSAIINQACQSPIHDGDSICWTVNEAAMSAIGCLGHVPSVLEDAPNWPVR